MLRDFRKADAPRAFQMLTDYFPEESRLLEMRSEAFQQVVDRAFRWDARLIFGLMNLVRRPILQVHIVDVGGQAVAMAMVTFPKRSAYISGVAVDAAQRHHGLGTRLIAACEVSGRRAGKPFAALDVLTDNAPARALYARLGYRPIRSMAFYRKDLQGTAPSEAPLPESVRPFRRRDAGKLTDIAAAQLPPKVADVLPVRPATFSAAPAVTLGLLSTTEAWVIDRGHGPVGFVRATASTATVAGHLSAPIVDPAVPDDLADRLVAVAVAWLHRREYPRVACEAPDHNAPGVAALRRAGFVPAFTAETLYRPLAA